MAFFDSSDSQNNFVVSFRENLQNDFGIWAKGYLHSAQLVAENLLARSHFADYEAYPVVFLYRHAFELYLKDFYYKSYLFAKGRFELDNLQSFVHRHKLVPLARYFLKVCQIIFPGDKPLNELANKVVSYAIDIEELDSDSYAFRYPIDKKGFLSTNWHQIINLKKFHQSMYGLLRDLDVVVFVFENEFRNELLSLIGTSEYEVI